MMNSVTHFESFAEELAMSVLMPLFVAALVWIFDLNPAVKMALVALSVAPVPTVIATQTVKTAASVGYAIGVLLMVGSLMFLAAPAMWTFVGNGAVLAIIAFMLVGLVIGHLLGGPTPVERKASP